MLNEAFVSGSSIPHRLDPRLRVVFATIFSCMIAVSQEFTTLSLGVILSVFMILLSGLPLTDVAKRLTVINIFNLILFLILPVTFEGNTIFTLGPFDASHEGVLLALRIMLKSNAILMLFIALIATMSIGTLGNTLNRLHMPQKIVYLLLIAYRYVFVLEHEYLRLVTAMRIRGFCPKSNMHTYKSYAYLFGMLLVRASARAERVYHSMLCRGFKGKFYCLQQFSFSSLDRGWAVVMTLIIVLLGGLEWLKITL